MVEALLKEVVSAGRTEIILAAGCLLYTSDAADEL